MITVRGAATKQYLTFLSVGLSVYALGIDDRTNRIITGAKAQLVRPSTYDGRYVRITFPNGDVHASVGVCTDVVIRSLRSAGLDLQQLIHRDIVAHPRWYPNVKTPDTNIDHRRVPNQAAYFSHHAKSLNLENDFRPGDVVWWRLPSGLNHVGVLSDRMNSRGEPFVIHNLAKTAEEDVLRGWKILGHFRL